MDGGMSTHVHTERARARVRACVRACVRVSICGCVFLTVTTRWTVDDLLTCPSVEHIQEVDLRNFWDGIRLSSRPPCSRRLSPRM